VFSFDIKTFEPLKEITDDEDELMGLNEENPPRKIGVYIQHDDFNVDPAEMSMDYEDPGKDLDEIEKVYAMDHDFVSV